jgi:hypothetical protein
MTLRVSRQRPGLALFPSQGQTGLRGGATRARRGIGPARGPLRSRSSPRRLARRATLVAASRAGQPGPSKLSMEVPVISSAPTQARPNDRLALVTRAR